MMSKLSLSHPRLQQEAVKVTGIGPEDLQGNVSKKNVTSKTKPLPLRQSGAEFTPQVRATNAWDILINILRKGNDAPGTTAENLSTNSGHAHHTSTINMTILTKTSSWHANSCSVLPSPLSHHRATTPDPHPHQRWCQFSQILGNKIWPTPVRG